MTNPWNAWSDLASKDWAHTFEVAGAEELSETQSLEQDGEVYTWALESVFRTPAGAYLFTRATRRDGEPDQRTVVVAASANELAVAIKAQLGMPPGRLEVLGRAGIEIGLEPDNDIEGDELNGPGPE